MGTNFQYKNGLSVCLLCTAVVYVRFLAISFIAELCVVDFHNPESKQALRAWADPCDFPLCAVWNSPRWAAVDVLVWFGGTLRVRPDFVWFSLWFICCILSQYRGSFNVCIGFG